MKSTSLSVLGVAVCIALAAALSWNTLPTNAEGKGGTCPLTGGAACSAKEAKAASGCCEDGAKTTAAKAECPMAAAAKLSANKEGNCATGECPMAAAAKKAALEKEGACAGGECKDKDIAKVVMSDSRFTTFALAVKAAGMTGEFACPKAKTVFAPTNDAFQKIPAEQWAALLQDDAKLKALVSNHIVLDNAMQSCSMKEAKTAKASGGSDLTISACPQSGQLSVNDAKVVGADLVASNGVVHAVDAVLMPAGLAIAKAEPVAASAVQVAASAN